MHFNSAIINIPGLTNSGPEHWQTLWEKKYGFSRIQQRDWDKPVCEEWIETIDTYLSNIDLTNTILIGHSLGCSAIAAWSATYNKQPKGALLVAPSDTEAADFPTVTKGFDPMPLIKLPFPTILVFSRDDNFVAVERARYFGEMWGSECIDIGEAGHINTASKLGDWKEGLTILKKLDQ